nr:MAG TPA: hypothetical protein [Caudoviricetes sp.]
MLKNLFKRIWKGVKKMAEKVNEGAKKVVETVKKAANYKAETEVRKVDIVEKVLTNTKYLFSDKYNRKQVSVVGLFLFTGLMLSTYIKNPKEV